MAENRNAPALVKASSTVKDVRDLLEGPKNKALMAAVLPRHMTADRMTRMATMATQQVPDLLKCKPLTLLGAFLGCSALGLEPNTPLQHCYLIPREIKNRTSGAKEWSVTLVIGYRGYLDLARRSGLLKGVHADVAFERDLFEHEFGTEAKLRHIPIMDGTDRGAPRAAYCHMALDGGQAFAVMPWVDVLKIRDASDGFKAAMAAKRNGKDWAYEKSPWVQHLFAMARKTAIRRACSGGEAPLSLEMANAVQVDERPVNFAALTSASSDEIKEGLGTFVDHQDDESPGYDEDGVVDETAAQDDGEQQGDDRGTETEAPADTGAAAPPLRKARGRPLPEGGEDDNIFGGR